MTCEDLDEAPEEIRALFNEHEAQVVVDCFSLAGACLRRRDLEYDWSEVLAKLPEIGKFLSAHYRSVKLRTDPTQIAPART